MSLPFFTANLSGIAVAGNLYTIHCASYKTSAHADADTKHLAAMGYPAYFTKIEIKGKGEWFRVYTGRYETKEKARRVAEEMVKKDVLGEYFIFPLSNNQSANNKEKNIQQKKSLTGKSTVIIANKDSKRYHLYGMPFYDKVKRHHRVLFNSESEAISAGYSKAGDSDMHSLKDKRAAVSGMGKNPEKSIVSESKPGKQSRQDTAKTAEKIQQVPHALLSEKKSGKAKNTEPIPAEKEEANSGSPLYDKALRELKEKKYDNALETFKEFVARNDTSNDLGERALRHMADCHFFLGEKGSKDHLLTAVQFYKNTLQSFPDQKRENALTYFRLAQSYEYLSNYSDALKNYENMLSKYPQSAYVPEAFFKTGALLHNMGKYSQAVDKLIAYLMKHRGGVFAKQAFYLVADCYYKTQQSASAEVWFRDAQKKWPDFKDIPEDVLFDMGQHKFSLRRYDEAIKIFSLYANVYSNDEKLKEVLLLLANSYKAAEQVSAALNVYNLIIDKYPESKEASESILAMASLGIDKPRVKVFFALNNVHHYKHPMEAYDLVLMKNPSEEIAQSALFQKGDALHKLKKDRKAVDIYWEFLKKYPQSKMAGDVRKSLKLASGTLIGESYEKKDYLAVADIYYKAYSTIPFQSDEYEVVNEIAVSLSNIGLSDDYINLLNNYKNVCKDDKISGAIMIRIAEAETARNKYDEAEKILGELMTQTSMKNKTLIAEIKKKMAEIAERRRLPDNAVVDFDYNKVLNQSSNQELKSWALFYKAQAYQKMDNYAEARKIFNKIKTESGPEGFWTQIVDYYVNDQRWWNKYGEYLKN